jgi:hypothetical protein
MVSNVSSIKRAIGAPDLLANVRNGEWLDAQTFAPLKYAVPGVIAEGFTLFIGAPKVGKSWATLDIGLGGAVGGVAFGAIRVGDPRPVFLLALEDGDRRLQDRARKLLDGAPLPAKLDRVTQIAEPGRVLETIDAWLDIHGDETPLVILDTLGKVMPPAEKGESAYGRDYRIGSALKRLVDDHPGASLVVNHHDRKAGTTDFVESVSGTNGLAGSADSIVVLSRKRNATDGVLQVTGRDIAEGEYALRFVDGAFWQLNGRSLEEAARRLIEVRARDKHSDQTREVIAYVNGHPDGVTPKQVDEALSMTDARQYLGRLAHKGTIGKKERGTYTPVTTVTVSQHPTPSDTGNESGATP